MMSGSRNGKRRDTGSRILRRSVLGVATAVPGLHFAAGALAALAARRSPALGIPAVIASCLLMFWFGGIETAAMCAAVITGILVSDARSLRDSEAAFVTAALTVVAAVLSLLDQPGLMSLSSDMLETLMPLYSSAGIPEGRIRALIDSMIYLSPGIGAFQIAVGSALAVRFATKGDGRGGWGEIRLGLPTAWLLIAALAAAAFGRETGYADATRAGACVLTFLSAPYGAVGIGVLSCAVRGRPFLLAAALFMAVMATPLAACVTVLTGVLDTWLDFRKRMMTSGFSGSP